MARTARNLPGKEKEVDESGVQVLENLQTKYEKNKNIINGVVFGVLAIVVLFFAYQRFFKAPKETKASAAVYFAAKNFESDSLELALNGDAQHMGFIKIIKKYSGTDGANISQYYAGVSYLKMGDFAKAIKHLKDFDGKGTTVEKVAYGALGDAYMETGKIKDGISYYKKASSNEDDIAVTPLYLYRLAVAYEMDNNKSEAISTYKKIRSNYPTSNQYRDVEIALARLGDVEP